MDSQTEYNFQKPGLKMGVENSMFFVLNLGSGFVEPGGTSPLRIPRSNPPGAKAWISC